eukprot:3651827-Rhodomonas_salina.1
MLQRKREHSALEKCAVWCGWVRKRMEEEERGGGTGGGERKRMKMRRGRRASEEGEGERVAERECEQHEERR